MKTERPYPFVTIDARGTKRAQEGHPWVFDNEITAQEGTRIYGNFLRRLSS